jgi:hypothetical protein
MRRILLRGVVPTRATWRQTAGITVVMVLFFAIAAVIPSDPAKSILVYAGILFAVLALGLVGRVGRR